MGVCVPGRGVGRGEGVVREGAERDGVDPEPHVGPPSPTQDAFTLCLLNSWRRVE